MVTEPLVFTEPVTEKRTMTPCVGFPNRSVTVAVTQCWESTGFVAVFGLSVGFAGGPATHLVLAWVTQQPATEAVIVQLLIVGRTSARSWPLRPPSRSRGIGCTVAPPQV